MENKNRVVAVIQCTQTDFVSLSNKNKDLTVVKIIKQLKIFDKIILSIGDNKKKPNKKILHFCKVNKLDYYIGDKNNVLKRIINSSKKYKPKYVVRFLLRQFYIDRQQLISTIKEVTLNNLDTIFYPNSFNYAFGADIFKYKKLVEIYRKIKLIKNSILKSSYLTSPSVYFEDNKKKFKTKISKIVIKNYSLNKSLKIRKDFRKILLGQNFSPSNFNQKSNYYNFTKLYIKKNNPILADIACGQGDGTAEISKNTKFTIGYDTNYNYIKNAKKKFKKTKNLKFELIKENFKLKKNFFDVITSFHTLEHVKNRKVFLKNIFNGLKPFGNFFLEVPLSFKQPMKIPLNPDHEFEPSLSYILKLLKNGKFKIIKMMIKNRHKYILIKKKDYKYATKREDLRMVCAYFQCKKFFK